MSQSIKTDDVEIKNDENSNNLSFRRFFNNKLTAASKKYSLKYEDFIFSISIGLLISLFTYFYLKYNALININNLLDSSFSPPFYADHSGISVEAPFGLFYSVLTAFFVILLSFFLIDYKKFFKSFLSSCKVSKITTLLLFSGIFLGWFIGVNFFAYNSFINSVYSESFKEHFDFRYSHVFLEDGLNTHNVSQWTERQNSLYKISDNGGYKSVELKPEKLNEWCEEKIYNENLKLELIPSKAFTGTSLTAASSKINYSVLAMKGCISSNELFLKNAKLKEIAINYPGVNYKTFEPINIFIVEPSPIRIYDNFVHFFFRDNLQRYCIVEASGILEKSNKPVADSSKIDRRCAVIENEWLQTFKQKDDIDQKITELDLNWVRDRLNQTSAEWM